MTNRKIVSVRRKDTGMIYQPDIDSQSMWESTLTNDEGRWEHIPEEVILNCPLFEVEYEPEPKIWRAEYGEGYIYIRAMCETRKDSEDYFDVDHKRHELGNYFHPVNDAEEIEQVRKEIAEVFARSKARRAK